MTTVDSRHTLDPASKIVHTMKIVELLQSLSDARIHDDLLIMKRIANRPKDLLDIAALEKISRGEDPNV